MPAYARPRKLQDALRRLAQGSVQVIAGGTDYYPARIGEPLRQGVLDVTAVPELRRIEPARDHWRIGAAVTWSELIEAELPSGFACLKLAAREIGGRQIQNAGTVGGNLCNASPAADGVPPLLALDARVELASTRGTRTLSLADFILGPRRTALARDELLTAIRVPRPAHEAASGFAKLGARRYLVISIAMAAAMLEHEDGVVRAARVAVGACSPVACRLPDLERQLTGRRLDAGLAQWVDTEHLAPLAPLDDHRGSATYRLEAVRVLLQRLLGPMR